jgi:hypothetical protein
LLNVLLQLANKKWDSKAKNLQGVVSQKIKPQDRTTNPIEPVAFSSLI